MFQLIHLTFTAPRPDPSLFSVRTSQMKALLANQSVSPDYAFNEALSAIMGQNHPRRQLTTAATIDQWNLEKSMAFYKDRFADASGFRFVFVGDFEASVMQREHHGAVPAFIERRDDPRVDRLAILDVHQHETRGFAEKLKRPVRVACDTDVHAGAAQSTHE